MAESSFKGINIPLNYIIQGEKQVEQVRKEVEKLSQTTTKIQHDVDKLTTSFTNGFNQARMVIQGMKEAYSAFDTIFGKGIRNVVNYDLELAKIRGVLTSQGKDPAMVGQMEELAGKLSKQSFFKKGEILGVERLMMTFDSMTSTTLPQATAAAVGLATVMDVDLRSAALALGKSLESPAEGMKALRRMGVILNEEDRERVKLLDEQGMKYEAQQVILGAVERKYKDVYNAIKDTDAFKFGQMEKALAGMQKNAAMMELQFLRPMINVIDQAANGLRKISPEMQGAIGIAMHLTAAYALLATTGLGTTIKNMLLLGPSIKANTIAEIENIIMTREMTAAQGAQALAAYEAALANKAFVASMGPMGWIILALTAVGTGLYFIGELTEENTKKQEEYNDKLMKMNAKEMQVQMAGVGLELKKLNEELDETIEKNSSINYKMETLNDTSTKQLVLEEKIKQKKEEQNKLLERQKALADDILKISAELDDELEIMAQGSEKERTKLRDKKWYEKKKADIDQMEAAESGGKKVVSASMISRLRNNLEKAFANKGKGEGTVRRESQTGSESLMEQLREEVKNTDSIAAMYQALEQRWQKIDTLSVKKRSGKVDNEATKSQREKMKGQGADIVQQQLEQVMRSSLQAAEVNAQLAGSGKVETAMAKLKAYNAVMQQVKTAEEALKKNKTGPNVLDKSTLNGLRLQGQQLQADINESLYRQQESVITRDQAVSDKRAELEGRSEMERLEIKRTGLELLLAEAKKYYQLEEAAKIEHNMALLELDKQGISKKAASRYEQVQADIAGRGSKNTYGTDKANADEEFLKQREKISNDELLTEAQKKQLIEQLERAHGVRLIEIKAQYYDTWLGKLAEISKQEIDVVQNIAGQMEQAFNTVGSIMDAAAQKEANAYRDKENAKVDVDEKRELARARTEQARNAIQEKYAARRAKIDEEADKKGKERIATIFALQKAAGIASVLISTYKGAAAAVEPPPVGAGPIMGPILAAATIAAGLAQIAMISQQEMPKYATGGYVSGPGGGRDDRITARLSNGEYVVNADATSRNRALLEAVNSGARITGGQAATAMLASRIESLERALMSRPMQVSVPIGDSECRRIVNAGGKVIRKGAW